MSEVKVGDRILSGNAFGETSFSSVISVPHGANDLPVIFLQLQLVNGMDLKLTAEHLLMGGRRASTEFSLIFGDFTADVAIMRQYELFKDYLYAVIETIALTSPFHLRPTRCDYDSQLVSSCSSKAGLRNGSRILIRVAEQNSGRGLFVS